MKAGFHHRGHGGQGERVAIWDQQLIRQGAIEGFYSENQGLR